MQVKSSCRNFSDPHVSTMTVYVTEWQSDSFCIGRRWQVARPQRWQVSAQLIFFLGIFSVPNSSITARLPNDLLIENEFWFLVSKFSAFHSFRCSICCVSLVPALWWHPWRAGNICTSHRSLTKLIQIKKGMFLSSIYL